MMEPGPENTVPPSVIHAKMTLIFATDKRVRLADLDDGRPRWRVNRERMIQYEVNNSLHRASQS